MSQKFLHTVKRTVKSYGWLSMCARNSLDCGKGDKNGCFYHFMSSLIFSAFTLEAYVNHIGPTLVPFWSEIEKIRLMSKLKIVYTFLELDFNTSKRPLQSISWLIKFRNTMAHGKTEDINKSKINKTQKYIYVGASWEAYCTKEKAQRAYDDIREIIEILNKSKKNPDAILWNDGSMTRTSEQLPSSH